MSDARKADLQKLLQMSRERAQKWIQLVDYVEKNGADAAVLSQVVIGSGDLSNVLSVTGQRANDFAAEMLDESEGP